jgi:hypothetical protein
MLRGIVGLLQVTGYRACLIPCNLLFRGCTDSAIKGLFCRMGTRITQMQLILADQISEHLFDPRFPYSYQPNLTLYLPVKRQYHEC